MTVPQWVFDNYLALRERVMPVVVLVPRRAIAEGLSQYISKVRGCELGQEVGLGMGGAAFMSADSRIIFMTYGFFLGVSQGSQHFDKWGAIILDEAHERKAEADKLLPSLAAACKARPDFKAVIMSATIEPKVFIDNLKSNGVPGNVPTIDVPGVTFPVDDVWWEGDDSWDPQADGAMQDLALESIRVYLQEKTGNVLVFVSTLAAVRQLVEDLSSMMKHDPECQVMGLYAALTEDERDEVVNFTDLSKYPQNKDKRLICVSTNVAEAGVTIKGETAQQAVKANHNPLLMHLLLASSLIRTML